MAEDNEPKIIDFEIASVEAKAGNWQSLFDIFRPEQAAQLMRENYGSDAALRTNVDICDRV